MYSNCLLILGYFVFKVIQILNYWNKMNVFKHFHTGFSPGQCNGGLLHGTAVHQLWYKDAPVATETDTTAVLSPEHPPHPDVRAGTACSASGMSPGIIHCHILSLIFPQYYFHWRLRSSPAHHFNNSFVDFTAYPCPPSPSDESRRVRQRSKSSLME